MHLQMERAPATLFDWLLARLPEPVLRAAQSPTLLFVARVAAALLVFIALDALFDRAVTMPGESYSRPVLAIEIARRFGPLVVTVLAAGLIVLWRYGALWSKWDDLQHGTSLRLFVLFLSVIVAWPFVTHGYNYYFDQGHALDRLLIVALLPLLWWRPLFVLPFLLLVFAMMGQLTEPTLGGSILAHKLQVLRAIGLFGAVFVVHAISGERRTDHAVFLVSCLVASAYWLPAVAKLRLGWMWNDHLYVVPLASWAHGWLGFLSPEEVVRLATSLKWLDPVMRVAVIIVEAACLFFLWNRRLSVGLLIAVVIFHLGVFALFGFLFWTWIALDLALLVLLVRGLRAVDDGIRHDVRFGLSVLLILAASWWARPPLLGWYDTALSYTYRVTAVMEDGGTERLHPRFFAPYEDVFTMSAFAYLVDQHAVLVGTYGVTHDRDINSALDEARSAEDVFALEQARAPRFNEKRARRFYAFLERFAANRNTRGDRGGALYALHSPPQFWSQVDGLKTLGPRRIRELVVNEITTFYDGQTLAVIRDLEIGRVTVAMDDTNP